MIQKATCVSCKEELKVNYNTGYPEIEKHTCEYLWITDAKTGQYEKYYFNKELKK